MSSSNKSHARTRTPMACMNCRVRKLKCRPSGDGSPCERCVKEGKTFCEYRPINSSSTSNNHAQYNPDEDNPVNLYPAYSTPAPSPPFVPPESQHHLYGSQISGGYAPNPMPTLNVAPQSPFQPNPPYSTPPYQQTYPSSPYPYTSSGYPAGQPRYQPPPGPQFSGHPSQYYPYAPPPGSYDNDQRGYTYMNGYRNPMDNSKQ